MPRAALGARAPDLEKELKKSVSKMKETGTKQGQILIEMGSITENNLSYALGLLSNEDV